MTDSAVQDERAGTLLEHALAYLAHGLPIFAVCGLVAHEHRDSGGKPVRCTSPGKVPLVRWKDYQRRLPTEQELRAQWRRWPEANIGLATGELSRIVVLDLDGDLAVHEALARGYPNGPHVFTGRVGGQHRYFAYRPDAPRNFAKRNGIDYRGDGGYVILPPSQHASGRQYVWGEELGDELPELPEWVDDMAARSGVSAGTADVVEGDITRDRNVTLTSLGGSMRRRGMSEAAILAALRTENETRCKPPLDDAEVRKVAHSVAGYGPQPAGSVVAIETDSVPAELGRAAFHGPLGRAALLLGEASEACPGAILLHLLSLVSVLLGNKVGVEAGAVFHPPRIWAIVIGHTGVGRKGTAEHGAYRFMRLVDVEFLDQHKASGLSSGEGLIEAVRDEQRGQQRNP
ncbi:MAG TPA: bifunctional DNA primase/polymerase, partial [Chloroflexota bacterium]|nr:bifunctional DNA primase/polymerase [Chloroflexota bacterium]